MRDRTVLSHADLHLLAKVAATVYDYDLLDDGATSPEVVDLCRRCSEAIARGEVLALVHPEMSLLTALANGHAIAPPEPDENGSHSAGGPE